MQTNITPSAIRRFLVMTPNSEQYLLTGINDNTTRFLFNCFRTSMVTGTFRVQYYLRVVSIYGSVSGSGWYWFLALQQTRWLLH